MTQGLVVQNLSVKYGAITALNDVTFSVTSGKIVTLLGANGAGKTTTLRAISGLIRASKGCITFEGKEITNKPSHEIVRHGVVQSPEGRMIFPNLTVQENLMLGAYQRSDTQAIRHDLAMIVELFPRLGERLKQYGGTLSGGEQQMLAIGRALMAKPRMLLLDEPSLGIAPILVKTIFDTIVRINRDIGSTIFLVEQNAHMALKIAHYAYILETGRITMEGAPDELSKNDAVRRAYLGEV